jgi:phosphoribosylamine--glycine ligase
MRNRTLTTHLDVERPMRVLVIGSGGREHAIAWKLHREGATLFCAPGNPGIAEVATCLPPPLRHFDALAQWGIEHKIDVTVIGPEAPLAAGVVDAFNRRGLAAFGPTQAAAVLESSKVFMKRLCQRYGVPTAPCRIFEDADSAAAYVRSAGRPLVIKADGLAAGKGVTVAVTVEEGLAAVEAIMVCRQFGEAGARVVVEEVLEGEEVSIFAVCDGTAASPLLPAQDHKRLLDDDRGPNTGGMGAYAPVPSMSPQVRDRIMDEILEPVLWAMAQEGRPYRGVLFAGIMLTPEGPQVLEFNVRLGDPEAQVLLPLLDSRLTDALDAVLCGRAERWAPRWRDEAAVCVVLASEGYPVDPRTDRVITGLQDAGARDGVLIFHAGTAIRDGDVVTAGGRVLNVVGLGPIDEARALAYRAVDAVDFQGKQFRRDIGERGRRPGGLGEVALATRVKEPHP